MKEPDKSIKPYPRTISEPLIGVVSNPIKSNSRPPLSNFRELVIQGRSRGLTVLVFNCHDVDWKNRTVLGWTLEEKKPGHNRWVLYKYPLFDVVYNRIPNRAIENRPIVKEFFKNLQDANIPVFNPAFLDKWVAYGWMAQDPAVSPHLPATGLLSNPLLARMLRSYGSVYIKPRQGSLGRGIIRIDRANNGFRMLSKTSQGYQSTLVPNLKKVWSRLTHLGSDHEIIVQATINLAQYRDRHFDIRTLIQKDLNGEWQITGSGVRLAAVNAHLTHVPNGGQVMPLKTVLGYVLNNDESKLSSLIQQIHQLSRAVASRIDLESGSQFGELSLDIGLDTEHKLWVFEANSKPFRFDEPEVRILSRNRILDYAIFLTRAKKKGSEIS